VKTHGVSQLHQAAYETHETDTMAAGPAIEIENRAAGPAALDVNRSRSSTMAVDTRAPSTTRTVLNPAGIVVVDIAGMIHRAVLGEELQDGLEITFLAEVAVVRCNQAPEI